MTSLVLAEDRSREGYIILAERLNATAPHSYLPFRLKTVRTQFFSSEAALMAAHRAETGREPQTNTSTNTHR